jgi:hypothetical protein
MKMIKSVGFQATLPGERARNKRNLIEFIRIAVPCTAVLCAEMRAMTGATHTEPRAAGGPFAVRAAE